MQPSLQRLAPLAVALWLFVSVWFPLVHPKSHAARTEPASLALSANDSCALCLFEAQPLCVSALPLLEPCPSVRVVAQPEEQAPLADAGMVLVTASRGPPAPLS